MARDFWAERGIALGEEQEIRIPLTRSYSGVSLELPIVVRRSAEPGPTVFISAAVHGDEINGTGVVQRLVVDPPFTL
ncbi:MAG: succinylglutamate desuccinylase/aspartoacylase family protein, partial [Armatimonadota bacterium]